MSYPWEMHEVLDDLTAHVRHLLPVGAPRLCSPSNVICNWRRCEDGIRRSQRQSTQRGGKNHHLKSGWVLDRSAVGYVVFCHSLSTDSLAGSGAPLALVVGFSRGHVRVVLGFPYLHPVCRGLQVQKNKKKKMARLRSAALVTRSRLDMET